VEGKTPQQDKRHVIGLHPGWLRMFTILCAVLLRI
jgi:hypothetical protein